MKCPQCNGRKYIELDKIGLRVCSCPGCDGTGEISDLTEITDLEVMEFGETSTAEAELLNDFEGVLNGNINGDNLITGSGDTSEPIVTAKPKAKRKTRKKAR